LVNNSALSGVVGVSSTTIGSWLSILEASDMVPHRVFDMDIVNHNGGNPPKIYFCDVGFAAHLLGISTPAQMNRDPLMSNLFENMIVMEAVKARYNADKSDQLYFFRNYRGFLRKFIPYEIKSSSTMDSKYTLNLKKFIPQRSERKGISMMLPLWSECRESKVRYPVPWGGKGDNAS
jgi:predicted AAA+ superfamily ATPase